MWQQKDIVKGPSKMITIVTILIHLGCQQWELKHRVNWTCDISYVLGSHLTFLALMAMLASECLPYRPINVGRFYERILCFKLHGKKYPMAFKFELLFFFFGHMSVGHLNFFIWEKHIFVFFAHFILYS